MGLDVLTENGQIAVEYSRKALNQIGKKYIETAQDTIADIDGFFIKDNVIIACYEIKSRDMSLDTLENKFNNEWIITYDKILRGAAVAKALQVPFCGVLHLIPDNKTMLIKITDSNGEFCVPIRITRSKTQATCNGGTANRVNAYIDMEYSRIYPL